MVLAAVAFAGPTAPTHAAAGRLFVSARQCEAAKVLGPGACRTAFANAMAEFAAKAPSFRSRRACFQSFGPCMPWPIGTRSFGAFRPQWIGIMLAADLTATPAVAPGRIHFDFTPQSTAALTPAAEHPTTAAPEPAAATILTPDDGGEAPSGPAPRGGGGFTVIDGVLTYPAPARFQPKALHHP